MLTPETLDSIVSACQNLERIRVYRVVFDHLEQLVQLLQASDKLSSISIQYVWWRDFMMDDVYFAHWPPTFLAEPRATSTVRTLHIHDCRGAVVSSIMRCLRTPVFNLDLRIFSVSASETDVIPGLFIHGAGDTIEILRLDYLNTVDYDNAGKVQLQPSVLYID